MEVGLRVSSEDGGQGEPCAANSRARKWPIPPGVQLLVLARARDKQALPAVGMVHCADRGQEAYPVISAYFLGSSAMSRVPIGYVVMCVRVVLSFGLGSGPKVELQSSYPCRPRLQLPH